MTIETYLKLVDTFIATKKNSWSENTVEASRSRLRALDYTLFDKAEKFHTYLVEVRKQKPYTVKTTFITTAAFYQWAMDNGHMPLAPNKLRAFIDENARLFKNAYQKKPTKLSWEDVVAKIKEIDDKEVRLKAIELLHTGMRWEESFTLKDGMIIGKGNKARTVHLQPGMQPAPFTRSYSTFLNHLKEVGLTPHTLRKVFATQLVKLGGDQFDLMKVMGWSSIQTATSYIESQSSADLMSALHKFAEGETNVTEQTSVSVPKTRKSRP